MKKIFTTAILTLFLLGAGCSSQSNKSGIPDVNKVLSKAGLSYTTTDKTMIAAQILGADAYAVSRLVEYKFTDSSVILLVGVVPKNVAAPLMAGVMSNVAASEATTAGLVSETIDNLNNQNWFGYIISAPSDATTKNKILSVITHPAQQQDAMTGY